jgi:serine O-acetyltransferase
VLLDDVPRPPGGHPLLLLFADIRASLESDGNMTGGPRLLSAISKALVTTRLQSIILFRLGQSVDGLLPPLASVIKYVNTVITGADIALRARIGPGLKLFHPSGVVIGPGCVIGARCTIMQGVTLGRGAEGSPELGDDVFVGPGAKVFGGLTVGDRSVIGANAVVLDSIPADSFAAGMPAKVIKRVDDPHQLRPAR